MASTSALSCSWGDGKTVGAAEGSSGDSFLSSSSLLESELITGVCLGVDVAAVAKGVTGGSVWITVGRSSVWI